MGVDSTLRGHDETCDEEHYEEHVEAGEENQHWFLTVKKNESKL